MSDGILSIAPAYNKNFSSLLRYYGIAPVTPNNGQWGYKQKYFGYYTCAGYNDQINLYRLFKVILGGLNADYPVYNDLGDLTRTLVMPFKLYTPEQWSKPTYRSDDFEHSMFEAVQHFFSKSEHCTILYSGGVDSAGILAACIKYALPGSYTVAHTAESISEYPLFYDYIVKNSIPTIRLESTELGDLPGTLLHGFSGDSLLTNVEYYSQLNMVERPWQDAVRHDEWGDDTDQLLEFTQRYIKIFGDVEPTIGDLCLWVKMGTRENCKYHHIHYDHSIHPDKLGAFYSHPAFYSWTYYHGLKHMINSHLPKYYKLPLKNLIYSVTHDSEYRDNKYQYNSRELWRLKCNNSAGLDGKLNYFFVDHTGERVGANSHSEYREKYGTKYDHYFTVI